jgi:hypothetical protein
VGHLSSSIKKSDLYYLFHKYGDIVEIILKDDYAFIVRLELTAGVLEPALSV